MIECENGRGESWRRFLDISGLGFQPRRCNASGDHRLGKTWRVQRAGMYPLTSFKERLASDNRSKAPPRARETSGRETGTL